MFLNLCKKNLHFILHYKFFCPDLGIFWCGFLGFYAHKHHGLSTERVQTCSYCKCLDIEYFKHPKICSVFGTSLAKTAGHDIFVSQQYPPSLTENLKELERQAKEIRKKDFNTQIRFSKGQLGLFRRKKGSKDEWEKVDKS